MPTYRLQCFVAARDDGVHVHDWLLAFHFGNVAVHARDFERPLFLAKDVLARWEIVVTDLYVLERTDRLELAPVHCVLFAKSHQCRHKIFPTLKHKIISVVDLDGLHPDSIQLHRPSIPRSDVRAFSSATKALARKVVGSACAVDKIGFDTYTSHI